MIEITFDSNQQIRILLLLKKTGHFLFILKQEMFLKNYYFSTPQNVL
jgi:hypothetical protein